MDEIEKLKELLCSSRHAVFFGGAGVSTESGIPDFRSPKGLYANGSPEYLLSRSCLVREPEKFFEFYRSSMYYPDAKPNGAHTALAKLEAAGKIKAVVTQNIDGLHQAAGSKRVYELHGTTEHNICDRCKKIFPAEYILKNTKCDSCGGTVRPDIVLYEEGLDAATWSGAQRQIEDADLLIVGGSSLVVYPAASLVANFRGEHLVIINLSPTPYDEYAELVIRKPLSAVLTAIE